LNSRINNRKQPAAISIENLYHPGGLIPLLQMHNLHLSRSMGQNFLLSRKTMQDIIERLNFSHEQPILEIGPGLGHLTWVLLENGFTVIALEKDRTFVPVLKQLAGQAGFHERLTILEQDATRTDYFALQHEHSIRHIIGNLPYYAVVPIVFNIAYSGATFHSLGFMVQKEVGERIAAQQGNRNYGRLSIVLNYLFDIKKIKHLPPQAFFPAPRVESVFLQFVPRSSASIEFARQFLERVVQIGFMHRRKKLRKQMLGGIIQKRVLDENLLTRLEKNFSLDQRAEQWSVQTWIEFAEAIQNTPPRE
jgi:16S rRNA (adenine1518-N6/adenine1519-N6)-dimethyltransferase